MTGPSASSLSPQAGAAVEAKRSRRVYVYWGIALTLLISTALFCWLVVVPVFEVRAVIEEWDKGRLTETQAVEQLGGGAKAAGKIERYVRLPMWVHWRLTPDMPTHKRLWAMLLLAHCGRPAVPVLATMLDDESEWRDTAVEVLGAIGPEARQTVPDLAKILANDTDLSTRLHAARALGSIGGHEAAVALERSKNDRDEDIRQAAAEALERIKASEASAPPQKASISFEGTARAALKSIGVDREPVAVEFRPMGIDRLYVTVRSHNPGVPNLTVVFWRPGQGWTLQGPSQVEVNTWLKKSEKPAASRVKQ